MSRNSISATRATPNSSVTSQPNSGGNDADNPSQNNPVDGHGLGDATAYSSQWKFNIPHNVIGGQRFTSPGRSTILILVARNYIAKIPRRFHREILLDTEIVTVRKDVPWMCTA